MTRDDHRVLCFDVGNSRVGYAIAAPDGLGAARHLDAGDAEGLRAAIEKLCHRPDVASTDATTVASVNPPVAEFLLSLLEELGGRKPLLVRRDLPLPIELEGVDASQVGADRACAAAAAFARAEGACAVASFGTATTMDCVSNEGRLLGGVILPGIQMGLRALHDQTAALPLLNAEPAEEVFCKSTAAAMNSGAVFAAVGALREVVERFAAELRVWPALLITGGLAHLVAPHADFIDAVVPDLCLEGVALAYRRAQSAP